MHILVRQLHSWHWQIVTALGKTLRKLSLLFPSKAPELISQQHNSTRAFLVQPQSPFMSRRGISKQRISSGWLLRYLNYSLIQPKSHRDQRLLGLMWVPVELAHDACDVFMDEKAQVGKTNGAKQMTKKTPSIRRVIAKQFAQYSPVHCFCRHVM